jgi:predicted PurR-regulated permease PerM
VGERRRWSNYVFAGLFGLALFLFARIILPFLMPMILGAFTVVLLEPVHARVGRWLPRRPGLVAMICTTMMVVGVLAPLVAVGFILSRELLAFADYARLMLERVDLRQAMVAELPAGLSRYVGDLATVKVEREIFGALAGGAAVVTSLLSAGSELIADVTLMTIATYYFFLDGKRLYRECCRLVPIDPGYLRAFGKEFRDVAYALFYGNALTGALQGLTGWLGFWLAGVPKPHIWAIAMVAVSFLPVGGTAIVWLPMGVYLLLGKNAPAGLFILGWGAVMVGIVDNMARPKICSARMTLHPLLVFVSMFGGFTVYGMMGMLVGPLIASLFMAMVRIYRRDFLSRLPTEPVPEPAQAAAPIAVPVAEPAKNTLLANAIKPVVEA